MKTLRQVEKVLISRPARDILLFGGVGFVGSGLADLAKHSMSLHENGLKSFVFGVVGIAASVLAAARADRIARLEYEEQYSSRRPHILAPPRLSISQGCGAEQLSSTIISGTVSVGQTIDCGRCGALCTFADPGASELFDRVTVQPEENCGSPLSPHFTERRSSNDSAGWTYHSQTTSKPFQASQANVPLDQSCFVQRFSEFPAGFTPDKTYTCRALARALPNREMCGHEATVRHDDALGNFLEESVERPCFVDSNISIQQTK